MTISIRSVDELLEVVRGEDEMQAETAVKELECMTRISDEALQHIDEFAEMLASESTITRIHGFRLLVAVSRWDEEGLLNRYFERMMSRYHDAQFQVVCACLQMAPKFAEIRPDLALRICSEVEAVDPTNYDEAMQPMLKHDKTTAVRIIRFYLQQQGY